MNRRENELVSQDGPLIEFVQQLIAEVLTADRQGVPREPPDAGYISRVLLSHAKVKRDLESLQRALYLRWSHLATKAAFEQTLVTEEIGGKQGVAKRYRAFLESKLSLDSYSGTFVKPVYLSPGEDPRKKALKAMLSAMVCGFGRVRKLLRLYPQKNAPLAYRTHVAKSIGIPKSRTLHDEADCSDDDETIAIAPSRLKASLRLASRASRIWGKPSWRVALFLCCSPAERTPRTQQLFSCFIFVARFSPLRRQHGARGRSDGRRRRTAGCELVTRARVHASGPLPAD